VCKNDESNNFNTADAAKYLTGLGIPVSRGTLEVWRCKGRGPVYRKVARWVIYSKKDLDTFAEGRVYNVSESLTDANHPI
jgi:hypothetical protein